MSLPYESSTEFNSARVFAYWRTYPLIEDGSPDAVVYNMRCSMNEDDYTKPALNTTMANTTNAQVLELPWTDASAYFVGDFGHTAKDGGLIEFNRKFATKPATSTERLVGSRSFPFPARGFVTFKVPATGEDADFEENLYDTGTNAANTKPAPLYETRVYWVDGVDTAPTSDDVFTPTLDGSPVDFVRDAYTQTWTNGTARNGDTFSASVSLSATSPTETAYNTSVTNGDLKVVDVSIERYMGNVFVQRTFKQKAQ